MTKINAFMEVNLLLEQTMFISTLLPILLIKSIKCAIDLILVCVNTVCAIYDANYNCSDIYCVSWSVDKHTSVDKTNLQAIRDLTKF